MVANGAIGHSSLAGQLAGGCTGGQLTGEFEVGAGQPGVGRQLEQLGELLCRRHRGRRRRRLVEQVRCPCLRRGQTPEVLAEPSILDVAQQVDGHIAAAAVDGEGADHGPRGGHQIVEQDLPLGERPAPPPGDGRHARQQPLQHHSRRQLVVAGQLHQAQHRLVVVVGPVALSEADVGEDVVEAVDALERKMPGRRDGHRPRGASDLVPLVLEPHQQVVRRWAAADGAGVCGTWAELGSIDAVHGGTVGRAHLRSGHRPSHRVAADPQGFVKDRHRSATTCRSGHLGTPQKRMHPEHVDHAGPERSRQVRWRLTWSTGPDAGAARLVGPGCWLVGRAPGAHIRCDDPALEPFHAELRLWSHGETQVVQLAGRQPVRRVGDHVRLGSSTLLIEHVDGPADQTDQPGLSDPAVISEPIDRRVRRRPRTVVAFDPPPLVVPEPTHDSSEGAGGANTALVSSTVALGGAVLVVAITGQFLFAVFAGVAAVASLATWVVGRWTTRRRRRRHARAHQADLRRHAADVGAQALAAAAHRRSTVSTLADAHVAAVRGGDTLWQRRSRHADAFETAIGIGDMPWQPCIVGRSGDGLHGEGLPGEGLPGDGLPGDDRSGDGRSALGAETFDLASVHSLADVPVTVSLAPSQRVLLAGSGAAALARSLMIQLAAQSGPADWRLVVTGDVAGAGRRGPGAGGGGGHGGHRRWTAALPHTLQIGSPEGLDDRDLLDLAADVDDGDGRDAVHTVVVVDGAPTLAVRTSAVRRCLAAHEDWAVLVVDDDPGAVPPPGCTAVVITTADGGARLFRDPSSTLPPIEVRVAGSGERAALAIARRLATWIDPEIDGGVGAVPATVGWESLQRDVGVDVADPSSIASGWRAATTPRAALGRAGDGVVDVDLVRDGPHTLLAGTTGAGKSELLRSLVLGLAVALPPDRLRVVLVDFKGGAAFDVLVDLPHVAGLVTDLEPAAVDRVLRSLRAELTEREAVLRERGVADVVDLADPTVLPRLVVLVDEFAALATDHPEVLHALVGIAQRGRSLGVHLVLATQRPAGVISDEIRANTNLRLALRLHDRADAIDVVGDQTPASFHRSLPGRCAMRLGPDELLVFQTAHVLDPRRAVAAVVEAADQAGIVSSPPLWCDPLPAVLAAEAVPADAIGMVDDPDHRARPHLRWRSSDGHLLVAGRSGSGVTTTLQRVAWHAASVAAGPPAMVVIDPFRSPAWVTMAAHPRCAAVVHPDDRELLQRVLHMALDAAAAHPVLVVIDGLGAVRRLLDPPSRAADLELFDRLLVGAPPGTTLLAGVDGPSGVSAAALGRFACRWIHHLHDPHEAALFGVAIADRVPPVVGRVHVNGGRHAQIAVGPLGPAPVGGAVGRLGHLPPVVPVEAMPPATWTDGVWHLPVALDAVAIRPLELRVADGDHVLVAGQARSGRSGAVARLAVAFTAAAADARVVVVARRRSPLRHLAADVFDDLGDALATVDELVGRGVPVLVAIDDAELVDDVGGRLAALVSARTPGLMVVAAARSDALRHSYGHWTTAVRRSGIGLLMAGVDELAGDLLGVAVPRHPPIAARPGLAWVVADGTCALGQVVHDPAAVDARIVAR